MNNFIEQMNEIVGKIDVMIDALEKEEETVQTGMDKIEELDLYLTDKDLIPNGFDAEELAQEVLMEYWNNQEEVQEVVELLDEFCTDVFNHLMDISGTDEEEEENLESLHEDIIAWYNNIKYCEECTVRGMIDLINDEIKDELIDYINDCQ